MRVFTFVPPPMPPYFHLQFSHFHTFSSIIFHFHISYILHFTSSWLFFRFFSNVFSSGFLTLFLPISFQYSSLSVGHPLFQIRGQLFHSYFFLPDVTFPVFLSSWLFLCFPFPIFQFLSIFPFHCLWISVSFLNTRHNLQDVVFLGFSFNSKVFPFHLSPRLFAIRFQAACFSCCLSSWLQARHADALL